MANIKQSLIRAAALLAVVCASLTTQQAWGQCDTTTSNVGLCLRNGSTPGYTAAEVTTWMTLIDSSLPGQPGVSTNTVNRLVRRDGSGNFSAGTITATLTGNASTATALNATSTTNNAADDQVLVGAAANSATWKTVPDCDNGTTSKLLYDQTANAWSCGTDQGASGGYATIQNETSALTQRTTVNFTGAGVDCVDNSGASRTDCTITSGGGSGTITTVGTCTTGNCAIEGGTDIFPVLQEGTANGFETTFAVTDPTADRTITYPDATGTTVLKDANNDLVATVRDIDLRKILPTRPAVQRVQVATSLDCSLGSIIPVCGSNDGANCNTAVDVTANPQVVVGTKAGQECTIEGTDSTNTVLYETGTGLSLQASRTLGDNQMLELVWDGSLWVEKTQMGELLLRKGAPSGYAPLDSSSLVPPANIPADHGHTTSAGAPAAGSCVRDAEIKVDTTNNGAYFCSDGGGGNPRAFASLGDTYNTISDGSTTASASGSEQLNVVGADTVKSIETVVTAGTPDQVALRSKHLIHATDCTALSGYKSGQSCWEQDDNALYICEPTSGDCDTGAEWVKATTSRKMWLETAACASTTGTLMWDTLATNAPTASCSAGTTETTLMRGVADFPDSDGDYSLQRTFTLPADWIGAIDLIFWWKSAAITGNAVWQATLVCRADGEVEDAAFNSASVTAADTAKGTTLQLNTASITGLTLTGCAAGELAHLKVLRNRTHASDSITGIISLVGVEITTRRTL